MEALHKLLWTISSWIVVLPVLSGIFGFKYLKGSALIIWILSVFATFPQLIIFFILDEHIKAIFFNIYSIVDFPITQLFFYTLLDKKIRKKFIFISCTLFVTYYSYLIVDNGINIRFINEIVCLDYLIYTTAALIILNREFDQENTVVNVGIPDFYFLIAFLLYAPVTVFYFSAWQYVNNTHSMFVNIANIINDLCNMSLYLLFTVGIIKSFKLKSFYQNLNNKWI